MTFHNLNTVLVLNSDPFSDKNMLENRKTVEIKRIDMCKERYKAKKAVTIGFSIFFLFPRVGLSPIFCWLSKILSNNFQLHVNFIQLFVWCYCCCQKTQLWNRYLCHWNMISLVKTPSPAQLCIPLTQESYGMVKIWWLQKQPVLILSVLPLSLPLFNCWSNDVNIGP